MTSSRQEEKNSSLLLGLIFGLVSGAVITLLSTPKTGEQVREELEKKIKEKQGNLPQEIKTLFQSLTSFYEEASKVTSDRAKLELVKQTEFLKKTLEEQLSNIKKSYEEAKAKVSSKEEKEEKEEKKTEKLAPKSTSKKK